MFDCCVSHLSYVIYCRSSLDVYLYVDILTNALCESMIDQQLRVSLVLYIMYFRSPLDLDLYVDILTKKGFGDSLTGPTDARLIGIIYHVLYVAS